jgi:putative aldouronate transport system substrate-binding protein
MKFKRLTMLLVCLVMILPVILMGCSQKNNNTNEQPKETTETESTQEPYVVKIIMADEADKEAMEAVAAEASKITKKKFNTTIELVRYGFSSFNQQRNLMLSSGEKIDLMPSLGLTVPNAANSGQVVALNDLLEEYGQDMLKQIPQSDWESTSVDGTIYAVRNNKELASGYGYAIPTEYLEALGVDVAAIKTEDDIENLLRAAKEKYPDMYPVVSDSGTMGYYIAAKDDLGGDPGVLEDATADSTTVVNWYSTDTYKDIVTRRYKWQQEGLLLPNGSTNSEGAASLIKAGKAFSSITNTKPGIESEIARSTGKPMTVIELVAPYSTTNNINNLWYVAHNSEKPGRAVQVLNEMYTNPELANLMIFGVEGKNYVVKDADKGIIDYPEGMDASNKTYSVHPWAWPNELISYVWATDSPTVWEDTLKFNETAVSSIAKGFVWNNSNVLPQIAAVNNVLAKYANALDCGDLDPADALPRLDKELKSAGIDEIIAEKQAQLDAWLAQRSQ